MRRMRAASRRLLVLVACLIILQIAGCAGRSGTPGGNLDWIELSGQGTSGGTKVSPVTKADGSRFKIAVVDIDPDGYTSKLYTGLFEGMKSEGWIEYDEMPFTYEEIDLKGIVDWLAAQDLGPYIEFSSDCFYYLAYDGEDAVRESLKAKVESGEVDLIIAAGTWPARVAIEFSDKVPVVAYPLGDAVTSGIVKAYDYSGVPNVWAQTDPTKYQRQMRVFHEVYNFTDTGTVFYDEAISGYKDYKASCDELGINFRTVRVDPLPSNPTDADLEAFNNNFLDACRQLVREGIDSFLLTSDMIKNDDVFAEFMRIFDGAGIPVFVQTGDWVARGCLLTVSTYDAKELGLFVANAIGQILNGAKPEEVLQEYVSTPYLILNMDSAKKLGIMPPFEMLISCEKIYTSENSSEGAA